MKRTIRRLIGVCALIVAAFIAFLTLGELPLTELGVGLLMFTGLGGMFLVCS